MMAAAASTEVPKLTVKLRERKTEELLDWADPRFVDHIHKQHPAPRDPETGEKRWERGIRLHGAQERIIKDRYRFQKVDGGVRGGKSFVGADKIYIDVRWQFERLLKANGAEGLATCDLLWGVVGPTYDQAEAEMTHLDRLLTEGKIPHELHQPTNQRWRITFPFCTAEVHTLTGADVTKLASKAYRGLVLAEAAKLIYAAYVAARNRVVETGGWVLMEGTFEETKGPWYALLTERWKRPNEAGVRYALPSWDNLVIFPGGSDDPKIQVERDALTPDEFNERYGGEAKRPQHVAIPEADERWHVVRRYPSFGTSFDPDLPVFLGIDPGTAHAYAVIAVQFEDRGTGYGVQGAEEAMKIRAIYPGRTVWVIDCVYRWDRDTRPVVEEVLNRPWSKNVQQAVIDFAGTQRNANGPPVITQWATTWFEETGRRLSIAAEPVPLLAGYQPHKRALLNAWPEEEAALTFDPEGKTGGKVVDPDGMRLFFDPDAAAPFFGGQVDGREWAGEYKLHRKMVSSAGTILRDSYRPTDDDAIKAVNYLLWHHFGVNGYRQRTAMLQSIPWEMQLA